MKGPKLDPPDGTTFDFEGGPLFDPFWYMFPLCGGPKLDPQNVESGAVLKVPFLRSPNNLLTSRCPSPELTQTSTEIGNKGCEQGRPPTPSPKKLAILDPKNDPLKNFPCTPLV